MRSMTVKRSVFCLKGLKEDQSKYFVAHTWPFIKKYLSKNKCIFNRYRVFIK